jgi:hypothetical protein
MISLNARSYQGRRTHLPFSLFLAVLGCFVFPEVSAAQTAINTNAVDDEADVVSIDAVIKSAFKIMSGSAGSQRDWKKFRSLFKPSAQFIVAPKRADGTVNFTVRNIDEFIASSSEWLEKNSSYETEVNRITEQFGHLAHAFSTYESREKLGAPPTSRGVSSFQLVHDGKRWWIVNWFWLGERPNMLIPQKYLQQN